MFDRVLKNLDGKEHPTERGFYQSSARDYLYVSKNGVLYDDRKGCILKQGIVGGNYLFTRLSDPTEANPTHILVGETFLEKPESDEKLVINHINGVKTDNRLSNLEWSSYSDSLNHAYRTGLRTKNNVVLVKDLWTGEITRHYSQGDAARAIGALSASVCTFLQKTPRIPLRRRYDVVREGSPWNNFPDDGRASYPGTHVQIIAKSVSDNVVIIFGSIARASERTGVDKIVIGRRLKRVKKGLSPKGQRGQSAKWEFYYRQDYEALLKGGEEFVSGENRGGKKTYSTSGRKAPKVKVVDMRTGSEVIYGSLSEFSKLMDVPMATLYKAVHKRGGWRNYHIEYMKEPTVK